MIIKTVQYNIGGGLRREERDDSKDPTKYCIDDLQYVAGVIKHYDPDIVFLQETHSNKGLNQTEELAKQLKFKYSFNHVYEVSHLSDSFDIGQGIISRYPISEPKYEMLENPNLTVKRPNGSEWVSHDKVISSCNIEVDKENIIECKTVHMLPFNEFNLEPLDESLERYREEYVKRLVPTKKYYLAQGDFNQDLISLKDFLNPLIGTLVKEVILEEPTNAWGKYADHIIYSGLNLISARVIIDSLLDHNPIYAEFEL